MSTTTSNFSRLQELLPELFQANQLKGESYLRCQLTPEISVLLPMESVQESLLVEEEEITPIPNMEAYVVGLMSSRDRVFCLIDLPELLGVTDKLVSSHRVYHTVVTRVPGASDSEKELLFGFAFHRVQGVTRINSEQMESVPQGDLPENLTPYIRGCVIEKGQEIPLLDLRAIINHSNLLKTSSI
jgi:twitching motility protein PilI